MHDFTVGAMFRFGWNTFKKRGWFFVGVTLLVAIISAIFSSLGSAFGTDGVGGFIGFFVNNVPRIFIGMGWASFFLRAHNSVGSADSSNLWHPKPFWKYLGASLLGGVAAIIGLIFLIVPGIILGLMFAFATYIVIDRGLGPVEALQESRRITNGHKWQLFLFLICSALINVLGALCLLVGLLVTVPVTTLAFVHAYRTLSGMAQDVPVA